MPRIPRSRREEGDESAGGEPQNELSSRGPADDDAAPHDSGPVGQDTPAGGEEGVRDAARDESSRERFVLDREGNARPETEEEERKRVSVVHEPLPDGHDDEYKWHTGRQRP